MYCVMNALNALDVSLLVFVGVVVCVCVRVCGEYVMSSVITVLLYELLHCTEFAVRYDST